MPRPPRQRARLVSAKYSEPPRPHIGPGPASTPHTGQERHRVPPEEADPRGETLPASGVPAPRTPPMPPMSSRSWPFLRDGVGGAVTETAASAVAWRVTCVSSGPMPSAEHGRGLLPSIRPVGRAERAQRPGQTQRHWFHAARTTLPRIPAPPRVPRGTQALVAVDEATAEPCLDEGKGGQGQPACPGDDTVRVAGPPVCIEHQLPAAAARPSRAGRRRRRSAARSRPRRR